MNMKKIYVVTESFPEGPCGSFEETVPIAAYSSKEDAIEYVEQICLPTVSYKEVELDPSFLYKRGERRYFAILSENGVADIQSVAMSRKDEEAPELKRDAKAYQVFFSNDEEKEFPKNLLYTGRMKLCFVASKLGEAYQYLGRKREEIIKRNGWPKKGEVYSGEKVIADK